MLQFCVLACISVRLNSYNALQFSIPFCFLFIGFLWLHRLAAVFEYELCPSIVVLFVCVRSTPSHYPHPPGPEKDDVQFPHRWVQRVLTCSPSFVPSDGSKRRRRRRARPCGSACLDMPLHVSREDQEGSLYKVPLLQTVLETFFSSASVAFAPGLYEVLQSSTPLALSFFKSLPTECSDPRRWGVYVLVLEKQGSRPKIYIGSGTSARYGVRIRFQQYSRMSSLVISDCLQTAVKNGYIVSHKGLLCWTASLPSAADVPTTRVFFVALDAAFCFLFWAIIGQTEWGYGMTSVCPWDHLSLEWDGLCTHNPLGETPMGDFDSLLRSWRPRASNARLITTSCNNFATRNGRRPILRRSRPETSVPRTRPMRTIGSTAMSAIRTSKLVLI
jgi:hypothetical protein